MAKRRSFVPESPAVSSLEGRVALSTFGSIGHWFTSQYHHVTKDLGIEHKKSHNAASGIAKLWKQSAATPPHHTAHAKPFVQVTANDTVKA